MRTSILLVVIVLTLLSACQSQTPAATPPPVVSVASPSPTPTPAPFNPSVKIIGDQEVVLQQTDTHCATDLIADLPVRAIRKADGNVELYLSSTTSFRMVGENLDSLNIDCTPVMKSDQDRNPADYNYDEWMGAPYTLDGQTVYAIIHQEYHGDQAGSVWQASGDYGSDQGGHQWSYLSRTGSAYREMQYDAAHDRWQGGQPLCQISAQGMHPDINCEPVRAWTSPITGMVTINGRVYDQDANGGNGISAKISLGDKELWSATIKNGDSQGQSYNLEVSVQKGDILYFSINALGDTGWDSTYFDPGINIGPAPCPSNRHDRCTLISLTYAVSTDGGATFTQPSAPDQLLAAFPYQYDPAWMRSLWQPSNIVKNSKDDYYYALIQFDEHSDSKDIQGMCAMRTQMLDDPTSWRAWDGTGFNMQFINPYIETDVNPADHTCTLVSPEIGALTYGLSYNTYFDKFIAVGVGFDGFYFSLSDDLIHWTPRQLIMKASQTFASDSQPPYYPYPTLIDPDSPSPNFDVTGRTPYLYFSRFDGKTASTFWGLLRVPIEFSK